MSILPATASPSDSIAYDTVRHKQRHGYRPFRLNFRASLLPVLSTSKLIARRNPSRSKVAISFHHGCHLAFRRHGADTLYIPILEEYCAQSRDAERAFGVNSHSTETSELRKGIGRHDAPDEAYSCKPKASRREGTMLPCSLRKGELSGMSGDGVRHAPRCMQCAET